MDWVCIPLIRGNKPIIPSTNGNRCPSLSTHGNCNRGTLTEIFWRTELRKDEKCLGPSDSGKKKLNSLQGSGIRGNLISMGKSCFLIGKHRKSTPKRNWILFFPILWMIGNSANLSSHVRVEVKPSHKQVHVFHIILPKSNNGKPKFWMGLSKKIIWFKNCLDQKTVMSTWFYMGKKSGLKKIFDSKSLLGQNN